MPACYHASIEGAQHGAKSLAQFLDYAKASGASGAQPSNYMLQSDKGLKSAKEIKALFDDRGMTLDGISCHCPIWVHTTAWTESPTIRPFIPADVAKKSPAEIEKWCENYMLKLMDLAVELGVKILPTFWGVAFGWEMATGYPWGFWAGPGYDFLHRQLRQDGGLVIRHDEYAFRRFLADMVGDLRQRPGSSNAHSDRNADPLQYFLPYLLPVGEVIGAFRQ